MWLSRYWGGSIQKSHKENFKRNFRSLRRFSSLAFSRISKHSSQHSATRVEIHLHWKQEFILCQLPRLNAYSCVLSQILLKVSSFDCKFNETFEVSAKHWKQLLHESWWNFSIENFAELKVEKKSFLRFKFMNPDIYLRLNKKKKLHRFAAVS